MIVIVVAAAVVGRGLVSAVVTAITRNRRIKIIIINRTIIRKLIIEIIVIDTRIIKIIIRLLRVLDTGGLGK